MLSPGSLHEAGHAIGGLAVGLQVDRVSLTKCSFYPLSPALPVHQKAWSLAVMSLGGPVATRRLFDQSYSSLIDRAWAELSADILNDLTGRCLRDDLMQAAAKIIEQNWDETLAVAYQLQRLHTLAGYDVASIIRRARRVAA